MALLVNHRPKADANVRKTTLIVAPLALIDQWREEITSKVSRDKQYRLKVAEYHGQDRKAGTFG